MYIIETHQQQNIRNNKIYTIRITNNRCYNKKIVYSECMAMISKKLSFQCCTYKTSAILHTLYGITVLSRKIGPHWSAYTQHSCKHAQFDILYYSLYLIPLYMYVLSAVYMIVKPKHHIQIADEM